MIAKHPLSSGPQRGSGAGVLGHKAQERTSSSRDHEHMMIEQYKKNLWVHFAAMSLGAWLLGSPLSFGYSGHTLARSDVASGALIITLAALSVNPSRGWARWANCFIGMWL